MKRHALLRAVPLLMLASSAAYGVAMFQALFVPWYVAWLSAAAFECTYAFLAFLRTPDTRRAMWLSLAAVGVSVVYNTLSSLFHIRPALLVDRPLWSDVVLAVLHGAPLAIVAYAVASLLLHSDTARHSAPEADAPTMEQNVTVNVLNAPPVLSRTAQVKQIASARGVSETTIWRAVKRGAITLESEGT